MLTRLREKPKGSILLLVLFLLIILAMMGSAFSILLPVEMRNARRDRANIQTAYAADAGVLWVMDQFDDPDLDFREDGNWKDLEGEIQSLSNEWEWRVASVDRLNGAEAYRVVTEGIRVRGSQKDVLRRAVCIIDNGLHSDEAAWLASAATLGGNGSPMGSTASRYWPGDVPINGDIIVIGTWSVDESLINFANGPTFTGTITQTDGSGNGSRGENYLGVDTLTQAQYDLAYTNGLAGVQTVDVSELGDNLFLSNDSARQRMQEVLFSTTDVNEVDTMHNTTSGTNGIHIPLNSDGVPNGGLVVNDGSGNNDKYEIEFKVDVNGNSEMEYTGDAISSINTISASSPSTLNNVSTSSTGSTFTVIHVTDGTSYTSGGEDRLVIKDNSGTIIYNEAADFSQGTVVYNHGYIETSGTFAGEKTVAASLGVAITGELIKDGLPRGMTTPEALADDSISDAVKERINGSLLGLVANAGAGNSSHGFTFQVPDDGRIPSDRQLHIHASMMGLAKTDSNTKMFGHNTGHDLPSDVKVHTYGQIATGPTNGGQFQKEMDFVRDSLGSITMDKLPIGFPSRGDGFRSNLRAYVDQQSFTTE